MLNLLLLFFQYDIPTYVGMLEEEVKDELMETDVPSEGKDFPCAIPPFCFHFSTCLIELYSVFLHVW